MMRASDRSVTAYSLPLRHAVDDLSGEHFNWKCFEIFQPHPGIQYYTAVNLYCLYQHQQVRSTIVKYRYCNPANESLFDYNGKATEYFLALLNLYISRHKTVSDSMIKTFLSLPNFTVKNNALPTYQLVAYFETQWSSKFQVFIEKLA